MTSSSNSPDQENTEHPWRSLHVFNIYRLILAGIIAVIFFFTAQGATAFGRNMPGIFGTTVLIWIALVFISGFASRLHWMIFRWLVYIFVLTDILFISILMFTSGGISSGLGTLLLVTIAASGILLVSRMPYVFAAAASLAVLAVQGYLILSGVEPSTFTYTQSGLLGAGLFAIALLSHTLANRIRLTEALAQKRGDEIADLSHLNELIIQKIESGILVVDQNQNISTANRAAQQILGIDTPLENHALGEISPILQEHLQNWLESTQTGPRPFRLTSGGNEILLRFNPLGGKSGLATMVFMEDTAQLSLIAQQVKLASLGRLTASIAHEIRNPLSAINHASQLFAESPHIHPDDKRLTEIIQQQIQRLNTIVENVLSLSRKENFNPEAINIRQWLDDFLQELQQGRHLAAADVQFQLPDHPVQVRIDPTHLSQIMCNLCDNGIRHAADATNRPLLEVRCTETLDNGEVWLDILDAGTDIEPHHKDKLFEPFFTTESTGTGLGLFIARELAELNHAHLHYIDNPAHPGAHFRLTLPKGD